MRRQEDKAGRYDVAVVGAGPAGLHAAFKAALLYRSVVVFDAGREHSRIHWVPRVANIPGRYGVSGQELLTSAYAAIKQYEEEVDRSFVDVHKETPATRIELDDDGFRIEGEREDGELVSVWARNFVLATGATDRQPALAEFRRRDIDAILPYANKGLADYCLLCDGHTVEGARVAVIGCDAASRTIAKSLKANFGADTVLVPFFTDEEPGEGAGDPGASWEEVEEDLAKWEIPILHGAVQDFTGIREGRFGIEFSDGRRELFDKAWISMGWYEVRSDLARQLGARLDDDGFVVTDEDGRMLDAKGKPIERAYAIGDVRSGTWKQIPIAWGQAESAIVDAFVRTRRIEPLEPKHPEKDANVASSRENREAPLGDLEAADAEAGRRVAGTHGS